MGSENDNTGSSLRILVVDDDEMITRSVCDFLNSQSHVCHSANTMDVASQHLGQHFYDVVLLDLQGGDIDRPRVAKAAREKGARVVTMSGAVELRPTLEKPFRMAELNAVLRA